MLGETMFLVTSFLTKPSRNSFFELPLQFFKTKGTLGTILSLFVPLLDDKDHVTFHDYLLFSLVS